MRLRHLAVALCGVLLLAPTVVSAQSSLAGQTAQDYLARNASRHGVTAADVTDMLIYDQRTSRRTGVTSVYMHQQVGGVPVVAGQVTVNVMPDGRILYAGGELVRDLAARAVGSASLSPSAAASALAADRGLAQTAPFVPVDQLDGRTFLSPGGVSEYPIPARLVYQTDETTGRLALAWEVGIYTLDANHYWEGFVDAQTGRVIRVTDQVVHDNWGTAEQRAANASYAPVAPASYDAPYFVAAPAQMVGSYRVLAMPLESPTWGTPAPPADARTLVADPSNTLASPYGWHDTNGAAGAEFTGTRGNNVYAYPDVDDNNGPDATGNPDGGAGLVFDYPVNYAQSPATYKEAATTNLFYWNNIIHDVMYQYGFTEEGGNFQTNNYGRGGVTFDDAVHAEAQDASNGSGNCNANMWTPTDSGGGQLGPRPRMQMYTCDNVSPDRDGDLDNGVIVHEYGHGITKRMTGGPANTSCLSNADHGGEGWSDWYGLMFTMDADDVATQRRPIGNWLLGQSPAGNGVRAVPYSTDFAVNNYTYQRTRTAVAPHGVGHVWSTILWEVTWELIGAHGFSPDIYNASGTAGNQIMMQLVTEALTLQPCSPGFVDMRDAILAADQALYAGAHIDLLWTGFARRGLGIGANQGSPTSNADNVEDFAEPETIAPAPVTDLTATPQGDFVTLSFTATGDDGTVGTASSYDVRYSTTPIVTDADFNAATQATGEPTPQIAGSAESFRIDGLTFTTTYYFALKVADNSFNISGLSNVAQTTTLGAPVANIPTATITAGVAGPGGTTTETLTISNTGPSSLDYSVSLTEVTRRRPTLEGAVLPEPVFAKDAPATGTPSSPLRGRGGPDAFGYSWVDSNEPGGPAFNWVDISTTGTAVTLGDDASATATLPFAFPFYGTDRTSVRIVSNGWLGFAGSGTSNAFSNVAIPTASTPNDFIAPFWDDLNPGDGGSIRYQDMGDGRFVVSWLGVPRYNDGTSVMTFQAILYPSGQIVYQYQTMTGNVSSSTIGIENPTGADGLQVAFDGPYVQNNLAVRFSALWVDASPASGTIPAGGSANVSLLFDATGLAVGQYQAMMTVATNDPTHAAVMVPITFNVGTVAGDDPAEAFEGTHRLTAAAPNPASTEATLSLAVAEAQTVRAELYDALGRRVAVLHEGQLAAREATTLRVSTAGLAAGAYVIRVSGEHFADTRRLTVTH